MAKHYHMSNFEAKLELVEPGTVGSGRHTAGTKQRTVRLTMLANTSEYLEGEDCLKEPGSRIVSMNRENISSM